MFIIPLKMVKINVRESLYLYSDEYFYTRNRISFFQTTYISNNTIMRFITENSLFKKLSTFGITNSPLSTHDHHSLITRDPLYYTLSK